MTIGEYLNIDGNSWIHMGTHELKTKFIYTYELKTKCQIDRHKNETNHIDETWQKGNLKKSLADEPEHELNYELVILESIPFGITVEH